MPWGGDGGDTEAGLCEAAERACGAGGRTTIRVERSIGGLVCASELARGCLVWYGGTKMLMNGSSASTVG